MQYFLCDDQSALGCLNRIISFIGNPASLGPKCPKLILKMTKFELWFFLASFTSKIGMKLDLFVFS